jgi:hypothetical protein
VYTHLRISIAAVILACAGAGLSRTPVLGADPSSAGQDATKPKAQAPTVKVFTPPEFWGSYASWGATGNDRRGHIWVGVTSNDDRGSGSAHLWELDPDAGTFVDRGNVVEELERLGIRRPNETQMKIHSRIVEAQDGYQYFSSMDESGEEDDGSIMPVWGGHLWRRKGVGHWEHLTATREALIAVATGGPYVYALGYFNHVLYQFDTRTRKIRSVTVGSAGGHVSRNFFADTRGHAFVSRVTESAGKLSAFLVEFDSDLVELAATPLTEYFERGRDDSHGIVAIHPGADGSWYFATGKGRLYQMVPAQAGPATVADLGWFHPAGPRYVASMFRDERSGAIYGAAMPSNYGGDQFEWVRHVINGTSTAAVFPYGNAPRFPASALVYGSMARDAAGRFYVVGTMNFKPFVLQVTVE